MVLKAFDPDRALYVGDSRGDVVAATNAGIDAGFLSRNGAVPDFASDPAYLFGGLDELLDLFERG